jgi:predicted nucleotidyltransferase
MNNAVLIYVDYDDGIFMSVSKGHGVEEFIFKDADAGLDICIYSFDPFCKEFNKECAEYIEYNSSEINYFDEDGKINDSAICDAIQIMLGKECEYKIIDYFSVME